AILNLDPAALLARVNTVLLAQQEPMVTVVCGYADSRKYQFTFATAGHPAPALLEPGQPPRFLACGGLPLAIIDGATYHTYTVQTVPGAMLVLYTDGAIEHSRDLLIGERFLLEAIANAERDESSEPAIAIFDAIFRKRSVGDDVAILTVAFQNSPDPPHGASSELISQPKSGVPGS
ncbi:MAG TPA: PP2C family protein-serine/threonine phosphatase, partial [Candidatus Baltobacteraceae bacterium]|nr:PP2C family protein-serine/threonine phosphatase [Candidatus Baltobacteraceae bacterium]